VLRGEEPGPEAEGSRGAGAPPGRRRGPRRESGDPRPSGEVVVEPMKPHPRRPVLAVGRQHVKAGDPSGNGRGNGGWCRGQLAEDHGDGVLAAAPLPPTPPAADGGGHDVPAVDGEGRVRRDLVQRVPLRAWGRQGRRPLPYRVAWSGRVRWEDRVVGDCKRDAECVVERREGEPEVGRCLRWEKGDGSGCASAARDGGGGRQ
jgi:hypothetical protein